MRGALMNKFIDVVSFTQYDTILDDRSEFANVSFKGIFEQLLKGTGADCFVASIFLIVLIEVQAHETGDVINSLAEGRKMKFKAM